MRAIATLTGGLIVLVAAGIDLTEQHQRIYVVSGPFAHGADLVVTFPISRSKLVGPPSPSLTQICVAGKSLQENRRKTKCHHEHDGQSG